MMHVMHVYPLDGKHITQISTLKIIKEDFMNICERPHTSVLLKSVGKTEQEPRARTAVAAAKSAEYSCTTGADGSE